jgi:hypothetical protein
MIMFTKAFWAGTLERAVKTAAQTLVAVLGVGTGLLHLDWVSALDVTAAATVLSVLTSLVTLTTVTATAPIRSASPPPAPFIPPPAGPTAQS